MCDISGEIAGADLLDLPDPPDLRLIFWAEDLPAMHNGKVLQTNTYTNTYRMER